jgi:hypothetical protein
VAARRWQWRRDRLGRGGGGGGSTGDLMMAARMAYAAISVAVAVWWWWRVAIRKATDDRWGSRQIFLFCYSSKNVDDCQKVHMSYLCCEPELQLTAMSCLS